MAQVWRHKMTNSTEIKRVLSAASLLCNKLDLIGQDPSFNGIWGFLMAHGYTYTGPDYAVELEELKTQLNILNKATESLRCNTCNSPREGKTCHKCGGELVKRPTEWVEPHYPPIEVIKRIGKEHGYNIVVHGSEERDLDLIAIPCTIDCTHYLILLNALVDSLGARVIASENNLNGRIAFNLGLGNWSKVISLSIMIPGSL